MSIEKNVQTVKNFLAAQHSHHGKVTNAAKILAFGIFQKQLGLIAAQPVPQMGSQLLHTFHATDASGKLRAEQTGICGIIREPPHCCKPLIDRSCSQSEGFEVKAEPENDGPIQSKARF